MIKSSSELKQTTLENFYGVLKCLKVKEETKRMMDSKKGKAGGVQTSIKGYFKVQRQLLSVVVVKSEM